MFISMGFCYRCTIEFVEQNSLRGEHSGLEELNGGEGKNNIFKRQCVCSITVFKIFESLLCGWLP